MALSSLQMTEIKTELFKKAQSGRDHFSIGVISNMGILDNLEAYWEKADKVDSCYFCQNLAKYNDVAQIEQTYQMVGVCERHSFKGLTS